MLISLCDSRVDPSQPDELLLPPRVLGLNHRLVHGWAFLYQEACSLASINSARTSRLIHERCGSYCRNQFKTHAPQRVDSAKLYLLVRVYCIRSMALVSSPYATFKAEDWADASAQSTSQQYARTPGHKIQKRLTQSNPKVAKRARNNLQWYDSIQGDLFQNIQH